MPPDPSAQSPFVSLETLMTRIWSRPSGVCSAVPSRTSRRSSLRSPCVWHYTYRSDGQFARNRNRPTSLIFDQADVIFGAFRGDVDALDQVFARPCPDIPLTGDHLAGSGAGT